MNEKRYTITDRRGMNDGQELPDEVCRVCGATTIHSKKYGQPTMECITYLKNIVAVLTANLCKCEDEENV
jgi:hypothetical protein